MWGSRCKAGRLAHLLAAQGCGWSSGRADLAANSTGRSAHRLPDAEAVAAKRERRKQRRHANRDLRERMGVRSCGWQFMRPPQARASHPPARRAAPAREADESMQEVDDWDLFQAVLGKPRNATERRKFAAVWKQWQAASSGSSKSSSSDSSSSWDDDWEGSSRAQSSANSSGSSSSSTKGSAGASAGPRWGQASWSWADFRQEEARSRSSSSGGFGSSGWGDEEAWYEPPRSSSSGRRKASRGDPWGWHSSWQQHGGSSWRQGSSGWQHGGSSAGSSSSSSSSSSSTWSSIQLLGLERSWLSLRCGRLLKKAYLAKAKALHPDVHAGSGASSAAAAEAQFKEVVAAYEALLALVPPAR